MMAHFVCVVLVIFCRFTEVILWCEVLVGRIPMSLVPGHLRAVGVSVCCLCVS